MCGRFIFIEPEDVYERFDITERPSSPLLPNYNVAPTQISPVIIKENPNKIILMKWGLIPHWVKDSATNKGLINARVETLQQKPSFRDSFRYRRCIIPANGFYEWKIEHNTKIPYLIYLKNFKLFGFAGLYNKIQKENSENIYTFTIITGEPNELISAIHNRMPIIISPEKYSEWLDPEITNTQELQHILKPYSSEEMDYHTVSSRVNNPRFNFPDLIERSV